MDEPNPLPFAAQSARRQAVAQRDPQADGAFFYAVTTTGVYCRPVCSSRRPRPEHIRFFDNPSEAEAAGFRPCKRCRPDQNRADDPHTAAVAQACRLIADSDEPLSLAQLATAVNLSPAHFHRLFKKLTGVTPRQYGQQQRLAKVQAALPAAPTVTDAIYEAGFASGSRFYENVGATLGMSPSAYRQGGSGSAIRYALAQSYLGWVLVAATTRGICAIEMGDAPEALVTRLHGRFPEAQLEENDATFAGWVRQVIAFLAAPQAGLDLPLDVQGTAFQRRVWQALQQIPAGQTATYSDLAQQIGRPTAVRAVAQACAANKIAVAIPCHRVIRSDGALGGYRWGLERKRRLLQEEGKM